jgi:serine/threonine protein kinase/tetratricopeptide (TPR) repeat protein
MLPEPKPQPPHQSSIGIDARAKAVFDEAIELTGRERLAFLGRVCAADAALRSRVEVLLRAAEVDDDFLREPGAAQQTVQAAMERPGARIGPYRLLDLIGEGGFGSVYLADQEHPVRRRVALKIIKLGMDTRAVVARFEQERQALAMMDHPNIAKVFDAGATATGRPYFVMELVEGAPITEYCDRARLSISDRLALFMQVCSAVQHAHMKGVIHRDLKPSNILVRDADKTVAAIPASSAGPAGPRAIVKVIDFGIAKAMERPLTDHTLFTEQGQPIGTPEYMSPEQADPHPARGSRDLDTRTDVYSLGVVLYELLTGLPPFDARQLRFAALAEIQRIIREVEPPRPSTRLSHAGSLGMPSLASVAAQRAIEPARLGSLLRGELDWIVMRALDKDRTRRYESPSALGADVARYLAGQAVLAAPPSRVYTARKFIRRNRGPVLATLLVAGALAAGAVTTSVEMVKARRSAADAGAQALRADREAQQARTNARVAESVNAMMASMIARADRGKEEGRADVTVREVMDAAAKELESGAAQYDPGVASMMALTIGQTYRELNLFEPASRMMRLHAEQEQSLHGPASPEYAEALGELAQTLKSLGAADEAAGIYERAGAIAAGAGEAGTDVLADLEVNRAVLLAEKGQWDAALTTLQQTIAACEARGKTDSAAYITGLNNLATIYYHNGNLPDAEKYFLQSVDIQRSAGGQSGRDLCRTLHNLAGLQYSKRDYPAAEKTAREELALARRLYGEDHMDTAEALNSLSTILSARGDLEGSEQAARESLAILTKLLAPDHGEVGDALRKLGTVLLAQRKYDDAEHFLQQACEITDRRVDRADPDSVFAHYSLASLMERRGAYAQAQALLRPTFDAAQTSGPLKEGSKYEWMRHATSSLMGTLLLDRAMDSATAQDERGPRFKEAESLIIPAAERLLVIAPKMGPKTRGEVIPAALERAIRFYEAQDKADPGQGHAALATEWRSRLESFLQPSPNAPK